MGASILQSPFHPCGWYYLRSRQTTAFDIFTYGQLHAENFKRVIGERYNKWAVDVLDAIHLQPYLPASSRLITSESVEIELAHLKHRVLYGDLTSKLYMLHISEVKWQARLNDYIGWAHVWKALHTTFATNATKSAIWQALHLNSSPLPTTLYFSPYPSPVTLY